MRAAVRLTTTETTLTAVFACFAFGNAAADESFRAPQHHV
jgi:hypothetical protein